MTLLYNFKINIMRKHFHDHLTPWEIPQHSLYKQPEMVHYHFFQEMSLPLSVVDPTSNTRRLKRSNNIKSMLQMPAVERRNNKEKKHIEIPVIKVDKCLQQNQSLVKNLVNMYKAKQKLFRDSQLLVVLGFIREELKAEKRINKPVKAVEQKQKLVDFFPPLSKNERSNKHAHGRSLNELLASLI